MLIYVIEPKADNARLLENYAEKIKAMAERENENQKEKKEED